MKVEGYIIEASVVSVKGCEKGSSTKSVKFQIAYPGQRRTLGTHASLALAHLVGWTLQARCDNAWRSGTPRDVAASEVDARHALRYTRLTSALDAHFRPAASHTHPRSGGAAWGQGAPDLCEGNTEEEKAAC